MEKSTKKIWPPMMPRTYEVEKPVTESIKDWAEFTPDNTACVSMGGTSATGNWMSP